MAAVLIISISGFWAFRHYFLPPEKISFSAEIQPLFSNNCYNCHGPNSTSRRSNLRFDRSEFAFLPPKSGKVAIIPGDAKKSPLYQRLIETDTSSIMPPPDSHKKLSHNEITKIKQWIDQGAQYEEHWAFIPPNAPSLTLSKIKMQSKIRSIHLF